MKLVFVLIAIWSLQSAPTQEDRAREQAVHEAVVAHTIVPIAVRLRPTQTGVPPVVLIRDQTIGLWEKWPDMVPVGCTHEQFALQHFDGSSSGGVPHVGADLTVETRQQLIEGFRTANRTARGLLWANSQLLRPVSVTQESELRKGDARWTLAVAGLSAPAFSTDGHALVYGRFSCGSECAYTWIFLLRLQDGKWRVLSDFMISIS